jgi:acetolactate synthase-1/3 small subunit
MKEKLILSVLVDNESGVLQRVASLFSRRGYNISSLTVSETEDEAFSRMTIETNTEPENFRQIERQLLKLEIVKKVAKLSEENAVSSELLLVKVHAKGITQKNELLAFNIQYGARVLDVSLETITLEFTGAGETIDRFITYLEDNFGIVELARTGVTSLRRGEGSFTDDI